MKKIMILFAILLAVSLVYAHTLKINDNIGVILHLEPNDEPVAKEKSTLFISVQDSQKNFKMDNCDCKIIIIKESGETNEISATSKNGALQVDHVFEEAGNYAVIIKGKPKKGAAEFQSFETKYEYYVKPSQNSTTIPFGNPKAFIPLGAVGIFVIILTISLSLKDKPRKESRIIKYAIIVRPYARKVVYAVSLIMAFLFYMYANYHFTSQAAMLAWLMRYYGLTTIFMLFIVLIPGLISVYFPGNAVNIPFIYARRAIGLSAFMFALMHAAIGFVYNLSGEILSILFLDLFQQVSIILALIAISILTIIASVSFDSMIAKLGARKWKFVQRFTYITIILALFHAFLIGSHFTNPFSAIALTINFTALALIILEAGATVIKTSKSTKSRLKKLGYYIIMITMVITAFYLSSSALNSGDSKDNYYEYQITGNITKIDNDYIFIDQNEIPEVMPAMGMIYVINDNNREKINKVKEGNEIKAEISSSNYALFELINITMT